MASKQSDPVYILAEKIIDSVQQIATSKTDKAAYDKTYSAIILGTNQKFVGDISEQDKTAIIEKFSIPEAVEEGEQTYYTFKINGAYYCKKQNGNFKLYDKVMVYIPNGDWSNMYFDYPDASSYGGGGGGSGEEHQLIVSVDAPGGAEPKLGDMWLFVRDETRTTFANLEPSDYAGIYTWQEDEDTEIQSWKSSHCTVGGNNPPSGGNVGDFWIKLESGLFNKIYICTATGSSTVWSEVYPDDETGMNYNLYISATKPLSENDIWVQIEDEETRQILAFYQYRYNSSTRKFEWTLGGVDIAGGSGGVGEKIPESYQQTAERFNDYDDYNIAQTTGGNFSIMPYDHVEGFRNHAVGGGSITNDYLNASGGNSIKGQHNMLTQCLCCDVSGEDNTVSYDKHSRISGKGNTDTSAGNLDGNNDVSGKNNTLTICEETQVEGDGNSVTKGYCSIIFGTGNTATFGNINPAQVFASIIGGNINQVHGIIASMVLGQNNDINDLVNSLVLGDGHTTSDRSTIDGGIVLGNGVVATSIPSGRSAYIIVGANTTVVGNTFRVDIDGWVDAARFIPQGADYAEYFEWADGNPENEDRRGLLVALDGDKIVPADGYDILGVISANPSVVGNSASLGWQGKFKRDVFGSIIKDKDGKPLLSDDYDPEAEYIPREVRPEWAPVGLVGRLIVNDKGNCKANDWVIADNGYAFPCLVGKTNIRVLKRIDETHVEVLVK